MVWTRWKLSGQSEQSHPGQSKWKSSLRADDRQPYPEDEPTVKKNRLASKYRSQSLLMPAAPSSPWFTTFNYAILNHNTHLKFNARVHQSLTQKVWLNCMNYLFPKTYCSLHWNMHREHLQSESTRLISWSENYRPSSTIRLLSTGISSVKIPLQRGLNCALIAFRPRCIAGIAHKKIPWKTNRCSAHFVEVTTLPQRLEQNSCCNRLK